MALAAHVLRHRTIRETDRALEGFDNLRDRGLTWVTSQTVATAEPAGALKQARPLQSLEDLRGRGIGPTVGLRHHPGGQRRALARSNELDERNKALIGEAAHSQHEDGPRESGQDGSSLSLRTQRRHPPAPRAVTLPTAMRRSIGKRPKRAPSGRVG